MLCGAALEWPRQVVLGQRLREVELILSTPRMQERIADLLVGG